MMSEKRVCKGDLALNWDDIPHTSGRTAHEMRCPGSESAALCDEWPSLGQAMAALRFPKSVTIGWHLNQWLPHSFSPSRHC